MREALAGLTTRGRAFVAAGATAIICAVLLDQTTLVRVGVLVLVLPLITAYVVGRSRYRLSLVRTVTPQLVTAGQPARVDITLANEGRTPNGVLMLEDQIPYALGSRPRFVLEGVGHGWRRTVGYQVRSDVRGRFELGPMRVRVSDPFGLVEVDRAFQTSAPLTVTPHAVPLPAIPLGGAWTGSGDNRPRAFATGSAEDVTVREYRRGDDLRRVHWPSSARTGELMVRREEQPWQSRATLFLDNRAIAHRGQGVASSLETAVSAAASIAVHLGQRGFTVRLVTATGEEADGAWHSRDTDLSNRVLLEALAVVETVSSPRVDTAWLTEHGSGALTVAVLGAVSAGDLPVLRRLQHHSGAALALALDVDAWSERGSERGGSRAARGGEDAVRGSAAPVLAQHGWRAVTLRPGDRLDTAWQELARSGGSRGVGRAAYGGAPAAAAGSER